MAENPRVMIVTGASSGIGRALALAAARDGYRVAIVARRTDRLDDVVRLIRAGGGSCVAIAGDVTARDTPSRIVDATRRAFGRIDVLVNNAGTGAYGGLIEQSDAAIEAQFQLNVAAPLRLTRAAIGDLERTGGQVFFLGSGVARVPLPDWGAYPLGKAAIRAAAIQLRRELRPRKITVTYVDPGVVASEFHAAAGIERTFAKATTPERIARSILRAIRRRSAVVNGVPWQTAFTTMAEWMGTLADPIVIRGFSARRSESEPTASEVEGPAQATSFDAALEPVARRMERVKLPAAFLRDALVPGTTLELGALAMRWAGMPNKNERAALREALDALTAGGYLERREDETWSVVRAGD